jgi:DNA-binding response OmpR family regulator
MTAVLIVEADENLRETLCQVIEISGYVAVATATFDQAVARLRTCSQPMIVLASNARPDHEELIGFFSLVRDTIPTGSEVVARRCYICLTTNPTRMPSALHALLAQAQAPVLAKPFALDELLAALDTVDGQLAIPAP